MYRKFFKRSIDILLALTAFIGFWWVYAIVGLLVRLKLGSPVIFSQKRPGKTEKYSQCINSEVCWMLWIKMEINFQTQKGSTKFWETSESHKSR